MATPSTPRKRLPVRPSLEHLRKQAKRLARAQPALSLSEAQHQLARDHGCRSWAELAAMVEAMNRTADTLVDVPHARRPLPLAVRARDVAAVERTLAEGDYTPNDLDVGLAHACWYDGDNPATRATRRRLFEILLEAGADPDGQYGSAYGPIVLGTGECLSREGLEWLLEAGCDVTFPPIETKYGPASPMISVLSTYTRGRNPQKHAMIDLLLARGAFVPADITPPLLAVHRGDTAALAALLDAEPALRDRRFERLPYVDCPGGTLLHYASALGEDGCIRLLVERGADVHARSQPGGSTALHLAAWHGPVATLGLLLDCGARGWIEDAEGRTAAAMAAESTMNAERDECVKLLTEVRIGEPRMRQAVAALDAGDVARLRALLAAHPGLARERVEGGDAVTRGYFARPTLLHFVACNPSRGAHLPPRVLESTAAILDAGAEVDAHTGDAPHPLGGSTLGLVASSAPAHADGLVTPLLELLVSRGADPALGIQAAILHRFTDTTRTLLGLGAPHTLLSAAGLGELGVLAALLPATAEERVRAGWAAAMNGQAASLALLIDAGLDPSAVLPRPFDPCLLHEAAWHGHAEVVAVLLARGADATRRDTQYDGTPADWARHAGHPALAELLDAHLR